MARKGRVEGKVALVTGVAKTNSIGFNTARVLGEEGALLAIVDISERVHACAEELRGLGFEVGSYTADVAKMDAVRAMVADVEGCFGRIDVLFNNAGIFEPGEVHEIDEEAWDRQLGVNLRSVYLVSHHVVPVMLAQGGGAIVNNASVAALVGDHNGAAYCASKGGVGQLTKAMALDYATRGIRVNAICCGEIDTPLFVRESGQLGMTPGEYRAILSEAHPMGRIGLPSEAAAAVAFLASDDASFVTGVLLPVDGGYSAT